MPSGKGKDQVGTPQYPQSAPPPSGDYSYTLEIVMRMQESMGGLKEAVSELKESVKELKAEQKEQTQKIESISKTIYAAMAIIALVVFLLQLFGPAINNLISSAPAPPAAQQQAPRQP